MRPERLPPELPLLLALTRRQLPPDVEGQITAWLAAGGQPNQLYALAETHGLEMLLYRGLAALRDNSLADLTARLEHTLTENAVLYEFVYPGQLAALLDALERAGVETLVLKGFALGQTVYGQAVLRPYGDFDLLVRESWLETAEQALIALGYQPDESQASRAWYRAHHHHLAPLVHPTHLPVEIHWGLVTPGSSIVVNVDDVWAEARPLEVSGVWTRVLSPEHLLVYLCIHAVQTHLFEMGLKPLCDVRELLDASALDGKRVAETCHRWRCERHVSLMLRLLELVSGVRPPVSATLGQAEIDPPLLDYCLDNLLTTAVAGLPESSGLVRAWQERQPRRRLRYVITRLLPSRETVADEYQLSAHSPKVWLHYPRWQWMMLRRHFKTAMRLLRGDPAALAEARDEAVRRELLAWLDGDGQAV